MFHLFVFVFDCWVPFRALCLELRVQDLLLISQGEVLRCSFLGCARATCNLHFVMTAMIFWGVSDSRFGGLQPLHDKHPSDITR